MKRLGARGISLVLLLPLAQIAGAATTTTASPDTDKPLDTVVVEGGRSQLDSIRQEMVLVEDRFYERYNQLNTNHDFDTHCYIEARVSTRTKRRYCRAVYQEKALAREGQDHAEAMKTMMNQGDEGKDSGGPRPWVPPPPATIMIEARRKDYQNNIRDVVKRNPELLEILRQRYELGQRYEATRHRIFGPKPPTAGEDTTSTVPVLP